MNSKVSRYTNRLNLTNCKQGFKNLLNALKKGINLSLTSMKWAHTVLGLLGDEFQRSNFYPAIQPQALAIYFWPITMESFTFQK